MSESSGLAANHNWRVAVWSLRAGLVGLVVAFVGLIIMLTGQTSLALAVGVIWWLITVVITLTSFLMALHELGKDRPSFWSMRILLARAALGMRTGD